MSGNCDKMLLIPSTTNQCPQQMMDGNKVSMGGTSNNRVMEKVGEEIVQQQQEALKCPRCDSSNTKFCYYNNYSLSQPRHFCKACKRYWTRGGTLRNVPVGGGCRKNKRLKRPLTTIHTSNSNSNSSSSVPTTTSQSHIDTASTSNHINPFFYGLLPNDHVSVTLPFPTRFNSSRISTSVGYNDLQTLGLGFSSQIMSNEAIDTNNNILVSSYYNSNIFGSSSTSSCTTTTPALSSLLNSTLLQQKFINGGVKDGVDSNSFQQQGLATLENLQMESNCSEMVASKDVKVEIGENNNRVEWNCQNQIQHVGLYDPNSLYWNNNTPTSMGVWNDQAANIGPSVTSHI